MKKCNKCHERKPLERFAKDKYKNDGLCTVCKDCRREYVKRHYRQNAEERRKASRDWYHQNKERAVETRRVYREKNIEDYRRRRKEQYWKDPDSAKEASRLYSLKRRWEDPLYRLAIRCRKRVWEAYSGTNYTKRSKTFHLIGCTQKELYDYLEGKFSDGMTWDNYGSWHVDHIIPLSSAKNEHELESLFHYTNLQPLWASENIRKGAKIDDS